MLKKLWMDEAGVTVSAEIVLVGTILVIGMVAGLTSLADGVTNELADLGQAIDDIDQSYSWNGITAHRADTSGSTFVDADDFCDNAGTNALRCVTFDNAAGQDSGT